MPIKSGLKALVLSLVVLLGFGACAELDYGITESEVAPPPPTLTVSIVNSQEMFLSWTMSAGADGYVIDMGNTPATVTSLTTWPVTPTTFQANHLQPGTQYCWQIRAYNNGFEISTPSNMVCLTTPGGSVVEAPMNVTAQAISESRIMINWDAVPGAIKYYVYQAQGANPFSYIGTAVAPQTSFLSTGLLPSTTYFYQIVAATASHESPPSTPPASATTFGPGGGVFEGYWKFDERTGTTAQDSSGFGRTATLTNGAAFTMTDRAPIDDNRSSLDASAGGSFATVANAPGFNLTGNFTVAFWAKAPAGGNVSIIGMRGANCGPLGWEIGQDAGGLYFAGENGTVTFGQSLSTTEYTHVAVTHNVGTMRVYVNGDAIGSAPYMPANSAPGPLTMGHVAGCNGGPVLLDEVQIYSRELSAADIEILGTVPPPPTNLTVTSSTAVSMELSWEPVPGATSYIISKGTSAGNTTMLTHSPNTPSYHADHLAPNTTYFWTVRAVVNGLVSNASNEASGTTTGGPEAPTNVTATVVAPDRIQVTWTAVSSAVKYYVFESVNGGAYAYRGTAVAPSTQYTTVNLQPGTTYSYQVQAVDNVQFESPLSAPASATTP